MTRDDIRLEKALDTIIDRAAAEIGVELAERCPTIIMLSSTKELLRETNNYEIAIELGLATMKGRKCPEGCKGSERE